MTSPKSLNELQHVVTELFRLDLQSNSYKILVANGLANPNDIMHLDDDDIAQLHVEVGQCIVLTLDRNSFIQLRLFRDFLKHRTASKMPVTDWTSVS